MSEIEDTKAELVALQNRLVKHIEVGKEGKSAYMLAVLRQALLWRLVELVKAGIVAIDGHERVVASLIVRACVETSAALYYLQVKVRTCLEKKELGDIQGYLTRLLLGRRDKEEYQPINVKTFLDHVAKGVTPEIVGIYDELSEVAHPNWHGAALIFSKPAEGSTAFGLDVSDVAYLDQNAALALWTSLKLAAAAEGDLEAMKDDFALLSRASG